MSDKKKLDEVVDIIKAEGFGYAITNYTSSRNIADPKLAKLWLDARQALDAVDSYITAKLGDDWKWS